MCVCVVCVWFVCACGDLKPSRWSHTLGLLLTVKVLSFLLLLWSQQLSKFSFSLPSPLSLSLSLFLSLTLYCKNLIFPFLFCQQHLLNKHTMIGLDFLQCSSMPHCLPQRQISYLSVFVHTTFIPWVGGRSWRDCAGGRVVFTGSLSPAVSSELFGIPSLCVWYVVAQ